MLVVFYYLNCSLVLPVLVLCHFALVLGDSAEKKTIRFDSMIISIRFNSIRFDEIVYCLFAFAFASPYGFVNNGYANSVFLGRPELTPYVLVVMLFIFFNQTQDLRAPSADRHETLPRDHYLLRLDNPGPKIQGALP